MPETHPQRASTTSFCRTPDGVRIAVEEAGAAGGPAVVFLHGFAQSRRVWQSVLDGPLAAELRLVAIDLRGHGDSDTPAEPEAYTSGERASLDLAAVIEQRGLVRPVVVAWSYGGVIAGDYLRRAGDGALGGLLLAAAAMKSGRGARELYGPAMLSDVRALLSDEAAVYEARAREFLSACAATPLEPRWFEEGVAAMLRVPGHVRRALLSRGEDYAAELSRCAVPLATVHGARDAVVLPAMSEHVAAVAPATVGARLEGAGHLTWIDAPDAFAAALRALVARRAA